MKLADTQKEQLFIHHYAQTGNATKSAEVVGYINNSRQMGYYLKKKLKKAIQTSAYENLHSGIPLALNVLEDLMQNSKSDMVKFHVCCYMLKLAGYTPQSIRDWDREQAQSNDFDFLSKKQPEYYEKADYFLESFELLRTAIEELPEEEQKVIAENSDDITAIVETVKKAKSM